MSRTIGGRTKEEVLLLAMSATAVAVVVASVREASPPSVGLWLATASALALAVTGVFAFWFGGAARRRFAESVQAESDAARSLLSAIPDGLLVVRDGRISSVNPRLCEMFGYERTELVHATVPYPFWPPEHRHEIRAWHDELDAHGEAVAELTFRHRRGDRIRMLVSGRRMAGEGDAVRHVVTLRDVSVTHRRERRLTELAARDSETGLLDRREFEERLGGAVRRAVQNGTNVTIVLAELSVHGRTGLGVFGHPEALLAVERLRRLVRAGDDLARTGDAELAWILPETDVVGGLEAIDRWRADLDGMHGVELTAGLCDLSGGGDLFGLYALADRALSTARRRGPGSTEANTPTVGPTASDDTMRM